MNGEGGLRCLGQFGLVHISIDLLQEILLVVQFPNLYPTHETYLSL